MNNDKTIALVQVGIVALVAAIVGGLMVMTFTSKGTNTIEQLAGASPVGSTFGDAKIAMVNASFLTSTSTSVLNTDSNSRYIKNMEIACTGVGTSQTPYTGAGLTSPGWKIAAATSTSAASSAFVNANPNLAFQPSTIATTSPWVTDASSTQSIGGYASTSEWLAGTYLDIFFNATNTAACTVGVSYIAS